MPSERLYTDLAPYWSTLSPPEDYALEADLYLEWLALALRRPLTSLLELGSGAGHLASHYPDDLHAILVDSAPAMLDLSRRRNPHREHVLADMRTVRLPQQVDAVLLHDAVQYMTSRADLRAAFDTAAAHLAPGGAFVVLPDVTRESFEEALIAGGQGDARMMEWHWDPDPSDDTYRVDFAYLLRDADGDVRCVNEHHIMGLYDTATWWSTLRASGFVPVPLDPLASIDRGPVFLARRAD